MEGKKTQDINREARWLSSMISHLLLKEPQIKYQDVAKHMLGLMVKDCDLSPLAKEVTKLLALPYPPFKRIVYAYLIKYSDSITDLNFLATNSLLKDFEDPNPFIRRLVIKTACRIPCLNELAFDLLPQALCDNSSYVRCTAVTSCTLVINKDNINVNQNIIDQLYEMIRDPEPLVVSSTISSLNEILYDEGGIVINSKLANYLIHRISDFHEWNFAFVCLALKKYVPKSTDELVGFLNALDEKLLNINPIIFKLTADLLLFYISKIQESFAEDIYQQISSQLKLLLNHSNVEILLEILDSLELYLKSHKNSFSSFYSLLFCRSCDTTLVKVKKLKIIVELTTESNKDEITEEVLVHCTDSAKELSTQAVHSFIKLLCNFDIATNVMNTFVQLLNIQNNNLNDEILKNLCALNLNEMVSFKNVVLPAVSENSHKISSVEGKKSVLKLIGDYGKDIPNSSYIIEQFINDAHNYRNESIMSSLITTSVKLFLHSPAEMQLLLGYLLQSARISDNLLLRKQSTVYYYLLKNPNCIKRIMGIDDKKE